MAKVQVIFNGTKYNIVKMNGTNFSIHRSIPDPHGSPADDIYANDYIDNLETLSIIDDGDIICISFDACNDQNLLSRVAAGKTRVRIQLLVHATSFQSSVVALEIDSADSWNDNGHDKYFTRPYSSGGTANYNYNGTFRDYEGITWKDLTVAELQAGYAELDCESISFKYLNQTPYRKNYWDEQEGKSIRIAVEMYCPALYRHNMNVSDYEIQGYRKVSNIYRWCPDMIN